MGVDQLRRYQAPPQQVPIAVDVLEDQVQQLGPLDDAGFEGCPLVAAQHHGHGIETPPRLVAALADVAALQRAVRGVGDAVLPEEAVHLPPAVVELLRAELGEHLLDAAPVIPDGPVGGQHLVVAPGEPPVGLRRRRGGRGHRLSRCDAVLGPVAIAATSAWRPPGGGTPNRARPDGPPLSSRPPVLGHRLQRRCRTAGEVGVGQSGV